MNQRWTTAQRRRTAWIGGGAAAVVVLLPLAPTMLSSFAPQAASAHNGGPTVVHLEIVAAGTKPVGGQITQPAAGMPLFVACPQGQAVDGGFMVPDDPGDFPGELRESAPAEDDPARWNFRFSGLMPVGTKFYTVCWAG